MTKRAPSTTQDIVELLEKLVRLHTWAGENPFKTRSFEKAAETLASLSSTELNTRVREGTLIELDGIGKGIAEVVRAWVVDGTCPLEEELLKIKKSAHWHSFSVDRNLGTAF